VDTESFISRWIVHEEIQTLKYWDTGLYGPLLTADMTMLSSVVRERDTRQPVGHADSRLFTSVKTVFSASVKSTTSKATSTVLERLMSQSPAWAPSPLQGAERHEGDFYSK